jgi:uncharacterized membrane protein YkoI
MLLITTFVYSINPPKTNKKGTAKYKKTAIHLKTKDGKRIKGYLVDANDQELFIVKSRKEIPDALDNNSRSCDIYQFKDLKKITFRKNFAFAIIGIALFVLAALFYSWVTTFIGEGLKFIELLKIFVAVAVPFLIINAAINKNKSIEKNIIAEKKVLISKVKSRSAKKIVLNKIFNSRISEIDLLRIGYINHTHSYLIIPIQGRHKKAYLITADEETLYYVSRKKHVKPALSGSTESLKKFTISKIANIR